MSVVRFRTQVRSHPAIPYRRFARKDMDEANASGRKPHRKSRFGCSQCKARRVKCDEQQPACSNCVRRSAECVYPLTSRTGTSSATGSSDWSPTSFEIQDDEEHEKLDTQHLELLHHFLTDTYFTLSSSPDHRRLWRTIIPNEALANPFLMHGIFAIAAQHLSLQRPEKKEHYAKIARKHHRVGLNLFRRATSNVTRENCNALLAFSLLVVALKLAVSNDARGASESEDPLEWMQLIRGIPSILSNVWEWIVHGELAPLLEAGPVTQADILPEDVENQLSQLFQFCRNSYDGEDARSVYELSLSELRLCYMRAYGEQYQSFLASIVFVWPSLLPEGFIALLRLNRPEALAVLAHYCVLLHKLDGFWWAQGTAMRLLTSIDQMLRDPWRYWIRWPMEQVTGVDSVVLSGFSPIPLPDQ